MNIMNSRIGRDTPVNAAAMFVPASVDVALPMMFLLWPLGGSSFREGKESMTKHISMQMLQVLLGNLAICQEKRRVYDDQFCSDASGLGFRIC